MNEQQIIKKLEKEIRSLKTIQEIADMHCQDDKAALWKENQTLIEEIKQLKETQKLLHKRISLLTGEGWDRRRVDFS